MVCPKTFTADGIEMQFGVNHIGHFLLTSLLLGLLTESGTVESPSRVVNLSSRAQFRLPAHIGIRLDDLQGDEHYDQWERYGSSKLANILFTQELQARLDRGGNKNVITVSLHPGTVVNDTPAKKQLLADYLAAVAAAANSKPPVSSDETAHAKSDAPEKAVAPPVVKFFEKSQKQGASTSLFCALSPNITPGGYYADCAGQCVYSPTGEGCGLAAETVGCI